MSTLSAATVPADAAVAGRGASRYHPVDDGRGTADAGIHGDRAEVTVHGAGPAFHTEVPVQDGGLFVTHLKNTLRTDFNATAAARAFVHRVCQGAYPRKIFHTNPHSLSLKRTISNSDMQTVMI